MAGSDTRTAVSQDNLNVHQDRWQNVGEVQLRYTAEHKHSADIFRDKVNSNMGKCTLVPGIYVFDLVVTQSNLTG